MAKDIRERLLGLCDVTDGCWVWHGARSPRGYGRLRVNGKSRAAHRVSYEVFNGPIHAGLFICHRCDNPPCINPSHLYAGTHTQNMKDMVSRRRHNSMKPNARKGDNNPKAKLSSAVLPDIRAKLASGISSTKIASEYGVSRRTIKDIRAGLTWRSV